MRLLAQLLAFAALIASTACSAEPRTPAPGRPYDVGPPNASGQTPAFPQQTRAPAMASEYALNVRTLVRGIENPWGLAFLPDGRFIFTERPGRMRIGAANGSISPPLRGLPEIAVVGQGGLLDILLSQDFVHDRLVYWSYAEPRSEGRNATAVARGRLSNDNAALENVEVIFHQQPAWDSPNHFGSRLAWDRQGDLFITLGERFTPQSRPLAQDISTTLGKVVRIRPDGSIPSDNPFVGRAGARGEIWSYGHRNVQGVAIHPETGQVWTIEHGPRGGDELNAPRAGRNYGWPIITYGEDYSGLPIGDGVTQHAGMEQPVYYWDPVIAPGGMTFYTGNLFARWRGDLLIGSLNPGAIVRIRLNGERVIGEERMLNEGRVRTVVQAPDGSIYALIDDSDGRILRLTPR